MSAQTIEKSIHSPKINTPFKMTALGLTFQKRLFNKAVAEIIILFFFLCFLTPQCRTAWQLLTPDTSSRCCWRQARADNFPISVVITSAIPWGCQGSCCVLVTRSISSLNSHQKNKKLVFTRMEGTVSIITTTFSGSITPFYLTAWTDLYNEK